MKKITSVLTVSLLSAIAYAQTTGKSGIAQVTFGRYGADCSSGRGACSFSVSKNDSEIISEKNSKKLSDTSILLQLNRNTISKEDEVKIAGTIFSEMNPNETVFFIQQSDLVLSSTTLQNLQINPKYNRIAAGNYPMVLSKDKVEIVFTLKSPE